MLIRVLAVFILSFQFCQAQESGPVIDDFGKVFTINHPDLPVAAESNFKAVFDIYDSPASLENPNPQLETAARYLNMHARHGISRDNLKVALVVHGKATEDILAGEAYRDRHAVANPNSELVRSLLKAGVEIAVCAQSATSRGIKREQTIEGVLWSLSAMTALVHYQNLGYRYIKF